MKDKLINWVLAQIIHRLKVSPIMWAILAAIFSALLYGLNYFQGLGYPIPEWVTSHEGIIGFLAGLALNAHSSKYVENPLKK